MQLLRFMHIPPGISHADLWLTHGHTMPCQCTCAKLSRAHARLTKAMSICMEQGRAHAHEAKALPHKRTASHGHVHSHEPKPCRASAQQTQARRIHGEPAYRDAALQPRGTCAKTDAASPARATRMIGVYRFAYFVRQVPLASHFLLLFSPFELHTLYHHARIMASPAGNFKHHGSHNRIHLTLYLPTRTARKCIADALACTAIAAKQRYSLMPNCRRSRTYRNC
jgi:hypothetical protein